MRRESGITLLEVLLASSVASIVAGLLVLTLSNHTTLFYKQSSIVGEGLGLNDALGEINNQVKQAAAVASNYPGVDPIYTASASTLILKLFSFDDSGIIVDTYDYVVVSQDSTLPNILRLQIFPNQVSQRAASNRVLTSLLKEASFSYLDKNGDVVVPSSAWQVGVTLNVETKTGSVGSERSSSILTTLRNN